MRDSALLQMYRCFRDKHWVVIITPRVNWISVSLHLAEKEDITYFKLTRWFSVKFVLIKQLVDLKITGCHQFVNLRSNLKAIFFTFKANREKEIHVNGNSAPTNIKSMSSLTGRGVNWWSDIGMTL